MPRNPSEMARLEEEEEEADRIYEEQLRKQFPWMQELTIRNLVGRRKYSLAGGKTLGENYSNVKKGL